MLASIAVAMWPVALLAGLLVAVREDLIRQRIPNSLSALMLGGNIGLHVLANGVDGLLYAIYGALVGLGILLPFYLARGMGAGDVKLMAAAGAYLGPLGALHAAGATLVLGAALAIVVVQLRAHNGVSNGARAGHASMAHALASAGEVGASPLRRHKFPYAAAIAGGVLFSLWYEGAFGRLAAAVLG